MLQKIKYLSFDFLPELYTEGMQKLDGKYRVLAGGTDLMVELHNLVNAPEYLFDIKKIEELHHLYFSHKDRLDIGPALTCAEIIENKIIKEHYPLICDAVSRIGTPQIRNRATIGGNICTASPCADSVCALLALGADVEIGSAHSTRLVPLKDFFTGPKRTQMGPHELLIGIIVPIKSIDAKYGMRKLKRVKGHDLALVNVAVAKTKEFLRIGVGACGPTPLVTPDLSPDISPEEAAKAVEKMLSPINDLRASKEYRIFMAKEYTEQICRELA